MRYTGVMNTEKYARVTFVLDRSTATGLHYVSKAMGLSASELARGLLEQPISMMCDNVRALESGDDAERSAALETLDLFAADALADLHAAREKL